MESDPENAGGEDAAPPATARAGLDVAASPEPPRGLFGRLVNAARQSVVGELVQEQLKKVEKTVLTELRTRITSIDDDSPADEAAAEAPLMQALATAARARTPKTPSALMADLLARAQDQTKAQAQEALLLATLKTLTPDEARMLAALSDGSVFPLIHVWQSPLLGAGQPVLENASSLGRASGVRLIERTPVYVTRLRALGLLDVGPEDPSLQMKYELLQTDAGVLEACNLIEEKRKSNAKLLRRTLSLSAWGRELWEFSHRPFTSSQGEAGAVKPA